MTHPRGGIAITTTRQSTLDRSVLITGASRGIGRAIARRLAAEAATVAITYRDDRAGAQATARQVADAGASPMTLAYDLEDDNTIHHAAAELDRAVGRLDVLVANAVLWPSSGPVNAPRSDEVNPAVWRRVLRANIEGTYLTVQTMLPLLRRSRAGRIVFISSGLAEEGRPGSGAYTAAKAALHGLARSLAWDLGSDDILVNTVMPGLTLTDRAQTAIPEGVRDEVARHTPSARLSTPEDVAEVVAFAASPHLGNVTGEILRVTGGRP